MSLTLCTQVIQQSMFYDTPQIGNTDSNPQRPNIATFRYEKNYALIKTRKMALKRLLPCYCFIVLRLVRTTLFSQDHERDLREKVLTNVLPGDYSVITANPNGQSPRYSRPGLMREFGGRELRFGDGVTS